MKRCCHGVIASLLQDKAWVKLSDAQQLHVAIQLEGHTTRDPAAKSEVLGELFRAVL
jgi:predicted Fe-S protein YdhL (DUF1289 family)